MISHIRLYFIYLRVLSHKQTMKNIVKYIFFAAAVLVSASCARIVSEGANTGNKRYLDAWLKINNIPESSKIGRGVYVIEYDQVNEGLKVAADGYAIVEYKTTDLEGNISDYTDAETAKQMGVYSPANYYGSQVWTTTAETIRAGLFDGINGMKVGERKKFIVPTWLMSYQNYATEQEYLNQVTDLSTSIFEVEVKDFTLDINQWQFNHMVRKFNEDDFYGGRFKGTTIEDTTGVAFGMFCKTLEEVAVEEAFSNDTTVYINYTGKLLNGLIFDTNIERVALDNDIYSSSKTYEPVPVEWGEEYSDLTLDGSEVIAGFSKTLMQMAKLRKGSKGLGMFYSELGYSYSGSTNIPGYSPLIFEIEFVAKPEE